MKTKSLKVGSAKTGSTKPSFSDLKELFTGGDNHDENSKGADISGKQTGKDTNSLVARNNPPSVPPPSVNYSPPSKPDVKRFDTATSQTSKKEVTNSYKSISNGLPDSSVSEVTGKSKSSFDQKVPGPDPGSMDQIADGIVAKNNSVYEISPDPKGLERNSNRNSETLNAFDQGKMKEGYLNQTGDVGKGNFKEGSESNLKYSDQFNASKDATSPNKAGSEMDGLASMDVNPNSMSSDLISKDGGDFTNVQSIGNKATSKSESLRTETSTKTNSALIAPVNEGIISQKSVIFGYFKL